MKNKNKSNINLLLENKVNKVNKINTLMLTKTKNLLSSNIEGIANNQTLFPLLRGGGNMCAGVEGRGEGKEGFAGMDVSLKQKAILTAKLTKQNTSDTNIDTIEILKYKSKLDALNLKIEYLKIPTPIGYLRPYLQNNNLFKVGQLENKNVFNKKLASNQFTLFNFSNSTKFPFAKAINLLRLSFLAMGCLISRPVFKVVYGSNPLEQDFKLRAKIIITLFFFVRNKRFYILKRLINRNKKLLENSSSLNKDLIKKMNANIIVKFNDKFQALMEYLTDIFKTEVELELVRLKKPYYNANILAQEIALNSYKTKFINFIYKIFRFTKFVKVSDSSNMVGSFPSYLSGIYIKSAGRIFRQRIIPKKTVRQIQSGSLSKENVLLIEKARFTGKTKRGSYSFTVKVGHIFH